MWANKNIQASGKTKPCRASKWNPSQLEECASFREAIARTGLEPPACIEPGRWVRFPGLGKGRSNRAGWCYLFPNGQAGAFGCWASGLSATWHARHRHLTSEERANFSRQAAEARQQAEREQAARSERAASRALGIWRKAQPAKPEHEYLQAKAVGACCARQQGPLLVLPVARWNGQLTSLQFIGPDGEKKLLRGGRKRGCFIPVHGQRGAEKILIAEGFATAATLADAEPQALVLAAIDAGNLEPVAKEGRRLYPNAEIVLAADCDLVGMGKAQVAALACGGVVALPEFPPGAEGTDFNDLAQWERGHS